MLPKDRNFFAGLTKLRLAVVRDGCELCASDLCVFPRLAVEEEYKEGDLIVLESEKEGIWLKVRLDAALDEALLYLPGRQYVYHVPVGEQKVAMNPWSFAGTKKMITARQARAEEVTGFANLSFNPYDQHENEYVFPHAHANVETRGEAWFAARNAVDGEYANHGHGAWPYQSWGINRDPEAALTIEFGTEVEITQVRITIRCDFPHDSYWTQADLVFDDEIVQTVPLEKEDTPQVYALPEPLRCRKVRLERLIKAEDESPFPALTQIELWGERL